MMAWLMFFLIGALEAFVYMFFYDSFLENNRSLLQRVLGFVVLYIIDTGNALVMEALPNRFITWKFVTLIALHIIYVRAYYNTDWSVGIYLAMLNNTFFALFGAIVFGLLGYQYNDAQTVIVLYEVGICIVWTGGLFILRQKLIFIKPNLRKDAGITLKFSIFPVISLLAGIYYYFLFIRGDVRNMFSIVVAIGLVIINVVSLFLLQDSLLKEDKLRLSEMQNEKNKNKLQAFYDMQSLYELQGRRLHDYKKQIGTIQELLKHGEVKTAVKYIEGLAKSIDVETSEVNVGHPVVNAVLNHQYRIAKSEGIGMALTIGDLNDIRLSDEDIVVLLGNLIENAIHESKRVKESGKEASIVIKFMERDGNLILTVRNPVCERVEIVENRVVRKNKEGHGLGLLNVEETVGKNGGSYAISCDDKEFVAVVMI